MSLIMLLTLSANARAEFEQPKSDTNQIANAILDGSFENRKFGPFIGKIASESISRNSGFQSNAMVRVNKQNQIQSYITLSNTEQTDLEQLRTLGINIELINTSLSKIQAWVDISLLGELSLLSNVVSVTTPNFAHSRSGGITTEGDAILNAGQLRDLGFKGQNVKIGIVADGSNDWISARDSADLPTSLTQFGSCTIQEEVIESCIWARSCNEGTAMAEIIHDLAPDSELAVASATTSLEFIQGINQLANDFQADIIVDDLGFFTEPFFEDGDVAQAVAALPNDVLFISAAGNNGRNHYEADFKLDPSSTFQGHDFDSNDDDMGLVIPARSFVLATLQWNEEFSAPSSDYDFFITTNNATLGSGQNDQSLEGSKSIEVACASNPSTTDLNLAQTFLKVRKVNGSDKRFEIFLAGSPRIQYPIPEGSVFGHSGLSRTLSITAINADEPGNDAIADYSSRGPSRIDFPSLQVRAKPDLTAIDGVMVSGAGGFPSPFFGTSAAAPHVAGIAAQLMSSSAKANAKSVRSALSSSAIDLGSEKFDSIYGYGRVDAISANIRLNRVNLIPPIILLLDENDD